MCRRLNEKLKPMSDKLQFVASLFESSPAPTNSSLSDSSQKTLKFSHPPPIKRPVSFRRALRSRRVLPARPGRPG